MQRHSISRSSSSQFPFPQLRNRPLLPQRLEDIHHCLDIQTLKQQQLQYHVDLFVDFPNRRRGGCIRRRGPHGFCHGCSMWLQWIVGTSDVLPTQESPPQCAQEAILLTMDTVGVEFDLSANDEGHRRNWHSERRMVWTETQVQLGWNHFAKISLVMFESQHICDRAMLADCVADQHDSTVQSW